MPRCAFAFAVLKHFRVEFSPGGQKEHPNRVVSPNLGAAVIGSCFHWLLRDHDRFLFGYNLKLTKEIRRLDEIVSSGTTKAVKASLRNCPCLDYWFPRPLGVKGLGN